jgi:hypothetical protein
LCLCAVVSCEEMAAVMEPQEIEDKDRKMRNHIRQLEALGYTVTLAPAA